MVKCGEKAGLVEAGAGGSDETRCRCTCAGVWMCRCHLTSSSLVQSWSINITHRRMIETGTTQREQAKDARVFSFTQVTRSVRA